MTTTAQKYSKLNNASSSDFSQNTTNLLFPLDLLDQGQEGTCVTFFPNFIKGHAVNQTGSSALGAASNVLLSPYGEVPILQTDLNKGSILQKNGGKEVFSNLYSRSGQSITLPLPKSLQFSYATNWVNQELGAVASGIDQISDYDKMSREAGVNLSKQLGANTVASVIAAMGKGGAIKTKELLQLGTATLANNYAETMFKSVSNRTIPFSWTLTPRNAKEGVAIDNLLRLFRYHMLPEFKKNVGNGNAYLLYPSSFDIVFWLDGAPHPYISRIGTCALTNIDINNTPNGQYFSMIDGVPQSVTLTLNFVELQTLSKDTVSVTELNTTF